MEAGEPAPGASAVDLRRHFEQHGLVVLRDVVPASFLEGVSHVIEELVEDRLDGWCAAGTLASPPTSKSLHTRYLEGWRGAGRPRGSGELDGVTMASTLEPLVLAPWLQALTCSLLGVDEVRSIDFSFVRVHQPDDDRSLVPWHQDVQCLEPLVGDDFVTVWLPVDPGGGVSAGLEVADAPEPERMYQCRMSELTDYTCMVDDDVQNLTGSRVLEVAHGDAIVLSPYVPHRSVANRTAAGGSRSDGADPIGQTRWSVDLRVAPVAAGRSAAG